MLFAQSYQGPLDWMLTRDNPHTGKEVYRNILLNLQKMRRVALGEGYDAVWVVESDIIPPPFALERLLQVDAPVATGLYVLRHGANIPNLCRYERGPNIGRAMEWSEVKAAGERTIKVSGGCMGCVLLQRPVLERYEFELPERGAPDGPLMQFCWTNGIAQMADLGVRCGHKEPGGRILWPEEFI